MDLEEAASLLAVHYQTAYRLVRNGVLPAVRVGFGYEIDPADVLALRAERERRRVDACDATLNWWEHHEKFAEAVTRGDETGARQQLLSVQTQGAAPVDLCEQLISPVIRGLEFQHSAGEVLSAEVAAAADLCERLVGSIVSPLPGRPRGLAVVASPAGDGHRLPSLMATAALRGNRWRVQHLGCGVPARDLVEFVEETEPTLVVLSVTVRSEAAEEFCRSVAGSTTVPVVAGGAGERLSQLLERVDAATGPKRATRTRKPRRVQVPELPEAFFAPSPASLLAEA